MRIAPLLLILAAPLAAGAALAQAQAQPQTEAQTEAPPEAPPQARAPVPADFPRPGYWEMTTKYQAIISGESSDRRCYGPADVPRLVQPCNHHYECTYTTKEARNGHLTLKGQWVGKKNGQVIDVSGAGAYTPDTFTAHADMHTKLLGLPLSGTGVITAHRLSATCPAGAKKG